MRKALLSLVTLALAAFPMPAHAQTTQPVYTRPSKGAALVVLDTGALANGATVTSAVYDMTAFSEVQLDARVTQATVVTDTFNVSRIGRYIKFRVTYTQPLAGVRSAALVYEVLESDSSGGTFTTVRGPGAWQLVMIDPNAAITAARLIMTPLPYITTQYTRPGKGNPRLVFSKAVTGVGVGFPSSPAMDMRGFASIAIETRVTDPVTPATPNCRYRPQVLIYGGATTDTNAMRLLTTPISGRVISDTVYYAVNVPASYISVAGNIQDAGAGNNCTVEIIATPLPYESSPDLYTRTLSRVVSYPMGGAPASVATYDFLPRLRLQNTGANPVACGAFIGLYPIQLAAATATGNGGTINLDNYAGGLFCLATSGTSSLTAFAY